jgi:hypothetical protein
MAMDSYDFSWQWIASHWKEENFTKIKSKINVNIWILRVIHFLDFLILTFVTNAHIKKEIMVIQPCCRLKD